MSHGNPLQLAGWRWMLLIEGAPTILLAALVLRLFTDRLPQAHWLTETERAWLAAELAQEEKVARPRVALRSLFSNRQFWAAAVCWFSLMSGAYGLIYWLPQVVQQFPGVSDLQAGVLSSLPWLAAAVGMIVNSRHSDRTQERHWHVGLAAMLSGGSLMLALLPANGSLAMLLLMLAGLGFGAGQSPFWTIPPIFLSASAAATGIALINMCGNSAGIIGPLIIGRLKTQTGSFTVSILLMGAVLIIGGLTLIVLRPRSAARGAL
jgi:ACS family tartrate transporter-like MFS transporter